MRPNQVKTGEKHSPSCMNHSSTTETMMTTDASKDVRYCIRHKRSVNRINRHATHSLAAQQAQCGKNQHERTCSRTIRLATLHAVMGSVRQQCAHLALSKVISNRNQEPRL